MHMESKGLFESKIFWFALVQLLLNIAAFFTKAVVPDGMVEQIVGLDWTNWLGAALSVLTILARVFWTKLPIKGLFG